MALLLVRFEAGVELSADALGDRWGMAGLGVPAEFVLPRGQLVTDLASESLVRPLVSVDGDVLGMWETKDQLPRFWGGATTWIEQTLVTAHARHAVVEVPCIGPRADQRAYIGEITSAVDEWVARFAQALEVVAEIDLHPNPRTAESDLAYVENLPIHVPLTDPPSWLSRGFQRINVYRSHAAASRAHVSDAVTLANARVVIPTEHLLLSDARALLRRGDCRRAVIDAAAACEVALSRSVRRRLLDLGTASGYIDQALRSSRGIVDVYDLHAAVCVPLPISRSRLIDQLAGRRNDAAHDGQEPTGPEAIAALAVAKTIVGSVSPIEVPD